MTQPDRAASGDPTLPRIDGLCALAVSTLPVDGAAVVLTGTGGHRALLAGTDRVSDRLENLVATCGEGPALDAVVQGRPVLAADLTDGESKRRWPVFSNEALGTGAAALFAIPLQVGAISIGVLVTHRAEPGGLAPDAFSALLRIADAVVYAVLDLTTAESSARLRTGTDVARNGTSPDLPSDFVSAEIHQASGMVMVQLDVPIGIALARLRAYAFASGRPLVEVARAVVARRLIFHQDNDMTDPK